MLSVGGLGVVGVVVLVYSGCCWFHEFFSVGSILVGGLSVDDVLVKCWHCGCGLELGGLGRNSVSWVHVGPSVCFWAGGVCSLSVGGWSALFPEGGGLELWGFEAEPGVVPWVFLSSLAGLQSVVKAGWGGVLSEWGLRKYSVPEWALGGNVLGFASVGDVLGGRVDSVDGRVGLVTRMVVLDGIPLVLADESVVSVVGEYSFEWVDGNIVLGE